MLDRIVKDIFIDDRYERYDGVNETLVISTLQYEMKVTKDTISLFNVDYAQNTINAHHGIPVKKEEIAVVDYAVFLEQDEDEIFGITKTGVNTILEYYRSLG